MSSFDGTWGIEIETPMGTQRFTLVLAQTGQTLAGTAANANGTYEVEDGVVADAGATFAISITAPFPLRLTFDLHVDGDAIGGSSKAGPFPASQVTGRRA
jgi:hypothetical protein